MDGKPAVARGAGPARGAAHKKHAPPMSVMARRGRSQPLSAVAWAAEEEIEPFLEDAVELFAVEGRQPASAIAIKAHRSIALNAAERRRRFRPWTEFTCEARTRVVPREPRGSIAEIAVIDESTFGILTSSYLLLPPRPGGRYLYVVERTRTKERPMAKTATNETKHIKGTGVQWRAARLELLAAEKEHTRRGDELARRRQELPWVRVDKEYRFDTDAGSASLADLFEGRSQLLVYHFMLGPDYKAGCPSCSAIADGFNGFAVHLANHDVMLTAVSRAQLAKVQAYKRRMGWSFPWASSSASDFNCDFQAGITEEQQRTGVGEYNFTPQDEKAAAESGGGDIGAAIAAGVGTDWPTFWRERPGMSAFALEDGVVYHTYSTYARGLDGLWGMYQWLDRAPKGRNETGVWWRRHDEYDKK